MGFIRTKIVATIGPSSADQKVIDQLVEAGCDVFRINFSHGTDEQHESFLRNIRSVEEKRKVPLTVFGDLCGPKIRVGQVVEGGIDLVKGERLIIQKEPILGTKDRISITLQELVDEVHPGQNILLNDGRLRLEVESITKGKEVTCRIKQGGLLTSGKGVNLPHTTLKLSAITEKDDRDARWIAKRDFDYVALSFVRSAQDVRDLRHILKDAGSEAGIISKIEKPQAMDDIDAIIDESDGVMVARGDLGVEMDLSSVPIAQKRIAQKCQIAGKPCIIATQMLETMTESPGPTRAEVSDVANAVLDCADAVMLSGETAAGKYPVESVATMNEVVARIEEYHDETITPSTVCCAAEPKVAALASAARQIISALDIGAIGVFTASGTTARLFSKSRLARPILAMSPSLRAVRKMGLFYGVIPIREQAPEHTREILKLARQHLLDHDLAKPGQYTIIISGRPIGAPGATNTLVLHSI